MGQKLKIWATMTSIILLSGMLGFGFSPDAFATHNLKGKGLAEGCNNGVAKNNPHCGISSPCDLNSDGKITASELVTRFGVSLGQAQTDIGFAEILAGTAVPNGEIETIAELNNLKGIPPYNVC